VKLDLAGSMAQQSSDLNGTLLAANGIDGNTTNFTHTSGSANDPTPWWRVRFQGLKLLTALRIHNRDSSQERLSDITVQIKDAAGNALFTSGVLNQNNESNGPEFLDVELPEPVWAASIEVSRNSGVASFEARILSIGELEAFGPVVDLAPNSLPRIDIPPSAIATMQPRAFNDFVAANAIDGNFNTFALSVEAVRPSLRVSLPSNPMLTAIRIHGTRSFQTDLILSLEDDSSNEIFRSGVLNLDPNSAFIDVFLPSVFSPSTLVITRDQGENPTNVAVTELEFFGIPPCPHCPRRPQHMWLPSPLLRATLALVVVRDRRRSKSVSRRHCRRHTDIDRLGLQQRR